MVGKGRWADNISIERWFRTLKTNDLAVNPYETPKELKKIINEAV